MQIKTNINFQKCRWIYTKLHGVAIRKIAVFIIIAVRTSDPVVVTSDVPGTGSFDAELTLALKAVCMCFETNCNRAKNSIRASACVAAFGMPVSPPQER